MTAPPSKIICTTCTDTHVMELRGQNVPCTRCPTPCERCRGRLGAYCAATPCACTCHGGAAMCRPELEPCRRCSECRGQEHHWIEANDRRSSRYVCKHCPAQCYAVDDEEDPLGGYKPSGIVIVVTPEMQAVRDQVEALVERLGNDMPSLTSARWLFEEVGDLIDAKLDAIEDGEIEDDDNDPDLDLAVGDSAALAEAERDTLSLERFAHDLEKARRS